MGSSLRRRGVPLSLLVMLSLVAPACGGSGGGASAPVAPLLLTAVAGNGEVVLTWNPVARATGYTVYLASVTGVTKANYLGLAGGSRRQNQVSPASITGLSNGTTYYFVLTASNSVGESAESPEQSATPIDPPGAPSGMTATAGNQQVTVAWNAVAGAASYTVYRATVTGVTAATWNSLAGGAKFAGVTSPLVQTGLSNGTTYYYVVTASNAGGESPESAEQSATPITIPGAPTGAAATPSDQKVTVTWNPVVGATSYTVYRATVTGVTAANWNSLAGGAQFVGVTSPLVQTGLTNGTTYFYVVTASNSAGEGTASTEVSAQPLPPPSAPGTLTLSPAPGQITVSWTAVTGATSYVLYRATVPGVTKANYGGLAGGTRIAGATSPYTDLGRSNGTAYYYVLTSVGPGGESAESPEASAMPLQVTWTSTGVGASPLGLCTADFNRDGIPDLAICGGTGDFVRILTGVGNGTFTNGAQWTVTIPRNATAEDFNRDGKIDLLVCTGTDVVFFPGNGDGTFGSGTPSPCGVVAWRAVLIDANRDGIPDVVVAPLGTGNQISYLRGNGDGTFQAPVLIAVGTQANEIAVADFNADGCPDLAVTSVNDATVSILLGGVTGTFAPPTPIAVGANPARVIADDFNSDGKMDLAIGDIATNRILVLLGTGGGGFGTSKIHQLTASPTSLVSLDLNGDGIPDVAATGVNTSLHLLPGKGDGSLHPEVVFTTGSGGHQLVVADFNRDGKPDVASSGQSGANYSVHVNGNSWASAGTFPSPATYSPLSPTGSLAVQDFNRDGILDLIIADTAALGGQWEMARGGAGGTFTFPLLTPVGGIVPGIAIADLDRDGKPDLALARFSSPGAVLTVRGAGAGAFDAAVSHATGDGSIAVVVADFNRDGIGDLAVVDQTSNAVSILLGTPVPLTFLPAASVAVGIQPSAIAAADLNRDGKIDLIVANSGSDSLTILLGNGDGTFATGLPLTHAGGPVSVAVADLNRDGKLDVISCAGTVLVHLGNGDGTFSASAPFSPTSQPTEVKLVDLNRDGVLDIVVISRNGVTPEVATAFGIGNGTFGASTALVLTGTPDGLAVGDFDRDGRVDLAVTHGTLSLTIFLNR